MNTRRVRRLHLSKVTVRPLDQAKLAEAVGGAAPLITQVVCAPRSTIWSGPGSCY